MDLSVVVPVYRSQQTLRALVGRITDTLSKTPLEFEVILVEDRGSDDSWMIIQELACQDPRVRGFRLSRNFGQHAATICGFSLTLGKWVASLDDDLEQPPEFLPKLYDKAQEGFDLVYGVYPHRTHNWWRNITSQVARKVFNLAIHSLNFEYTSFRVIRGDIARELQRFESPFPFVDGYLSWLTNNYATVQVPHLLRADGRSNYTFGRLLKHTLNIFVTFSDLPLKLASWLGIATCGLGMTWLGVLCFKYITDKISVSGFSSIMAAVLTLGGMQLLILGIFGEYIGRMNFKSSGKPLFLIAAQTAKAPRQLRADTLAEER